LNERTRSLPELLQSCEGRLREVLEVAQRIEAVLDAEAEKLESQGGLAAVDKHLANNDLESSGKVITDYFVLLLQYVNFVRLMPVATMYGAFEYHFEYLHKALAADSHTKHLCGNYPVKRSWVRRLRDWVCRTQPKPKKWESRGIKDTRKCLIKTHGLALPADKTWQELRNVAEIRHMLIHRFGEADPENRKLMQYVKASEHFGFGLTGQIVPEPSAVEYVFDLSIKYLRSLGSAIENRPAADSGGAAKSARLTSPCT